MKVNRKAMSAIRVLLLMNEERSNWCSLYRAKCGGFHPWIKNQCKLKSPQAKAIQNCIFDLKEGFRTGVVSIDLWNDPWLDVIPLRWWPTMFDVTELSKISKVEKLMEKGEWILEKIDVLFGNMLIDRIKGLKIGKQTEKGKWVWGSSRNGELTVRKAYQVLKDNNDGTEDMNFDWKRMWSLKVGERVKYFLWKLAWGRLPTSGWPYKFSGNEEDKCFICNKGLDVQNHIFFQYEIVDEYWRLVEKRMRINFKHRDSWMEGGWLMKGEGFDLVSAEGLLAFIAKFFWLFWKNRNKVKYEEVAWNIGSIFNKALNETLVFLNKMADQEQKKPDELLKKDEDVRMMQSRCCLMVDGAWKEGVFAGCGFVVMQNNHVVMKGQGLEIAECPLHAELKAIWFGLDNVRKKGIRNLLVLTDCSNALKLIRGDDEVP
ncbi:hypothetical protein Cni_G16656 [Canna indica]|uniref:RNase H type-1 domain-containing protein n=1 Tax=Canna indica TaxID=4628 RepID=A0AAQ3QFV2_9LILI|nr:hypothetical protein Cni_G16656 [Canna indica]